LNFHNITLDQDVMPLNVESCNHGTKDEENSQACGINSPTSFLAQSLWKGDFIDNPTT